MKKNIIGLLILTVFIFFGCGGGGGSSSGGDVSEGPTNNVSNENNQALSGPDNVTVTPLGISRKATTATPYNTGNEISWDPVPGAFSYNIYWSNSTPFDIADIVDVYLIEDVTSPYIHSSLDSTETYYYKVTSIDGTGESLPSDEASSSPLAAPTTVVTNADNESIEINWDIVTGASSYNIYWLNTAGVTTGTGTLIPDTITTNSYTHTEVSPGISLTNNREYFYIITAVEGTGEGSASTEVSAIPAAPLPSAPVISDITSGTTSNVITWTAPTESTGIVSYNMYWLNVTGVTAGNGNVETGVTSPYTHSSLTNDLAYYYIVTAIDDNGEGTASTEDSATPVNPTPSVPGNVTATAGNTSNEIAWDAVAGATSYNIYYNTTGDVVIGENPLIGVTAISPYTHTHTSLVNYTNDYYYIVTVANADGESSASTEVSATPVAIPTNVNLTSDHNNNHISWDLVNGATSYNIYWLNAGGVTTETGNVFNVPQVGVDPPSYIHSNLTSGLDYFYIVSAVGPTVEGPATTESSLMPISPPANVTATAGDAENVITWDAVAGTTTYNIYWATTTGVDETSLNNASVVAPNTSYTHTPLLNDGTKYFYVVTAENSAEESLVSSEVSATPVGATIPANITATAGDTENVITWDTVAGATNYNIYWATITGVDKTSVNNDTVVAPDTSYTHTPLLNDGTEYFYVVTAVVATVNGDESPEVSAIPVAPPAAPAAPSTISVTAGNTCNIVTWDDTVADATSYNIYWHTISPVAIGTGNKITNVTTPYTHPDRVNGTEYFYIVTAVNGTVEGVASAEDSATPIVRPAIPANITATAGDAENVITWDIVAGATSYNIYWLNNTGVTKLNGTQITGVARPYTHTPLTNGDQYFYIVTAINDSGEGGASSEVSATPAVLPGTPTNVSVVVGNGINVISWDAMANTTSYNIYWLDVNAVTIETGNVINIPQVGVDPPPTSYTHAGLTNDTPYYYVVTAVNGTRESAISEEKSGTPAVPSPGIPANVTATPGDTQNMLIWDAVTDATTYNVYWGTAIGETPTKIADVPTNSYSHTDLTNGITYYYKITANIATEEGLASTEVSAMPILAIPTKPVNVTATPGNTNNTIIWDESGGATSYNLYWNTTGSVAIGNNPITDIITTSFKHTGEPVEPPTGLTPDTKYYYIVTAVNSSGESSTSDEVSAVVLFPRPVTDTGLTSCYDNTEEVYEIVDSVVEYGCPEAGEAFFGQDGNYPINPQTYTKLDSDGNVLPISATSWAMVRDSGTGLIWEVKTDDASAQDKDNTYTWADALTFVDSLNTASFGRFTDWRLPNVKELKSIVDNSRSAPCTNGTYFLNTEASHLAYYWTSTEFARYTDSAWHVHFVYGVANQSKKFEEHFVRAVRGGP